MKLSLQLFLSMPTLQFKILSKPQLQNVLIQIPLSKPLLRIEMFQIILLKSPLKPMLQVIFLSMPILLRFMEV